MRFKEKLRKYYKNAKSVPINILLARAFRKISGLAVKKLRYRRAVRFGTYIDDSIFINRLLGPGYSGSAKKVINRKVMDSSLIQSILNKKDRDLIIRTLSKAEKEKIINSADDICDHKFDLLGSGKAKLSYNYIPNGVEGYHYDTSAGSSKLKKIKEKLREKSSLLNLKDIKYEPIDWQLDFKSGYRWDKNTWYGNINYGGIPGVDVKVPWELSRLQHLITLGQAYVISKNEKYALEYIYQIVDWVENNPPQMGVNWKCTMDTAIRAANWVLSLSFFKESEVLTEEFLFYFIKNIYIHGKHIIDNLEYETITSNHYLSNIAGLFFISGLLKDFKIGSKWRRFSISELKKEIEKQVYPDGVDFEASTCYHRLVLESLFYPILYMVKSSESFKKSRNYTAAGIDIAGEEYIKKLLKMFEFILYSLKPNKEMPQIGDNDNGRIFIFGIRKTLDMSYLLVLAAIFFNDPRFRIEEFGFCPEVLWVFGADGYGIWNKLKLNYLKNINSREFGNTGWYVLRKNKNYMIVSAGPNGQNGNGGHAHNDKLSFEIFTHDMDIIIDPGAYLYTPLPEQRNRFRSTSYHNTISVDGREQNDLLQENLFTLGDNSHAAVSSWKTSERYDFIEAHHHGYARMAEPVVHRRLIVFDKEESFWVIKDILTGKGRHRFNIYFHFNYSIGRCESDKNMVATINAGKKSRLKIIPLIKDGMKLEIKTGQQSIGYGIKVKNFVARYYKEDAVPVEFLFVLTPYDFSRSKDYIDKLINRLKKQ
jgi:hypothetical protein